MIIHKCVAVRLYYDLVITTMKIDIYGQFPQDFVESKRRDHTMRASKQASKQIILSLPPKNRKLSLLARAKAGQAQ